MMMVNKSGVEYLSFAGIKSRNRQYLCRCPDCGNTFVMFASNYYSGMNICKCQQEHKKKNNKRLYSIWCNMKNRCYSMKNSHYKNYGRRGIIVCDEWKDSFETFCKWAKANGYAEDLTIDRIDVNGNYESTNCRWVNNKQQSLNRQNTLRIGEKPLKEYCEEHELSYQAMYARKKLHPDKTFEELVKYKKWEVIV